MIVGDSPENRHYASVDVGFDSTHDLFRQRTGNNEPHLIHHFFNINILHQIHESGNAIRHDNYCQDIWRGAYTISRAQARVWS